MTAAGIEVGPGNEGQAEAWDGNEGKQWASRPGFYDGGVRLHHEALMRAADIRAGEAVLDVGCGNGRTTCDAGRASGSGPVLGIDLSSPMLAVARSLAEREGLKNVSFVRGDAQVHRFEPQAFDIAISRFGSMFFADQVAAFTNIGRALRPGGRVALVSWAPLAENEWISAASEALTLGKGMQPPPAEAPSPFRHALPDATRTILTDAGFTDISLESVEVPMFFGTGADEAFDVLSVTLAWMMQGLEEEQRPAALESLRSTLKSHETAEGVAFRSSSWLISARRG